MYYDVSLTSLYPLTCIRPLWISNMILFQTRNDFAMKNMTNDLKWQNKWNQLVNPTYQHFEGSANYIENKYLSTAQLAQTLNWHQTENNPTLSNGVL